MATIRLSANCRRGSTSWPYRRYDAECWADYYGVAFREPPNPHFDYRLLVKAATAAKRLGGRVPYSHALFRTVWVGGVWPLDEAVCRQAAESVGLSLSKFSEALVDPATEDELRNTAAEAHRRGAFGVPTFFVGDRMFWGNDRLVLVRHYLRRSQ